MADMVEKTKQAFELGKRAEELADKNDRNPLEMGLILLKVKQDPDLWQLDGAKSLNDWRKRRFGKRAKTAWRNCKIAECLLPFFTESDILQIGLLKAYALSRLPESELQKPEWVAKAQTMSATSFEEAVTAFFADRGTDHRDKFHTFTARIGETLWEVVKKAMGIAMKMGAATKQAAVECIFSEFLLNHQDQLEGDDEARN